MLREDATLFTPADMKLSLVSCLKPPLLAGALIYRSGSTTALFLTEGLLYREVADY